MISILRIRQAEVQILFLRYLILCFYSELFLTTVHLEKANKANDHGSCQYFNAGQVLDIVVVVVSNRHCQAQPKR